MANQRYSAKEQQAFHNKMAKPGAVKYDPNTGKAIKVSDFERGVHKAKADNIAKHRAKVARQHGKK